MSQITLTAIFIIIWLPSVLFTLGNSSLEPAIVKTELAQGPYNWTYDNREILIQNKQPQYLLYGKIDTESGLFPVIVQAGFIEWLYAWSRNKSNIKIIYTGQNNQPFITEWFLENDGDLVYTLGGLRFNWIFIVSCFFCLILPAIYILMLFADNMQIETPEERKRKDKAFEDLVSTIEARAEKDPQWLKNKTILLAFLGYFVVFSSILLMIPVGISLFACVAVLTGGNVLGLKIALVLALFPLGFAWHMGLSLLSTWVTYEGTEIKKKDCPALFHLLENISKKANGPQFKRVFIDDNLNASVTRSGGVLGFFGMGPVVLTLGLPLMQSMNIKQLSGVIGHEYGHIAAKDNAWGQWVYRIRNSWLILGERLKFDQLWYVLKLNRFYQWFIATFSAHSFALSRQCEYEADAFSARLVGTEAMAECLSSMAVFGDHFDTMFWNKIWDRSQKGENIQSVNPYSGVPQFFASMGDVSNAISSALKQKTNFNATHPSISDRLAAISEKFREPQLPGDKASSQLLGNMQSTLISQFDNEWRETADENWQERQKEYKELQKKHEQLVQKPVKELTDDETWELVSTAGHLKENTLFYKVNEEILRRYPDNKDASFNCIWYKLVIEKDDTQLANMEQLQKTNPEYLPDICRYAIEFLSSVNREEETTPYYERLENWEYIRNAAEEERDMVLSSDEYKAHELPVETIEKLVQYFSEYRVISTIHIAQKVVKYLPEYPCYIIAYQTKAHFWNTQKNIDTQVATCIYGSGLSSEYTFIELTSVTGLNTNMKKLKGSRVYKK